MISQPYRSVPFFGPAGVVDAAGDHDHGALRNVISDAFANTVEAGDAVPFGLGLAIVFAVLEAACGDKRDRGDLCAGLRLPGFGSVANKADEGDRVLHEICLSKLFLSSRGPSL